MARLVEMLNRAVLVCTIITLAFIGCTSAQIGYPGIDIFGPDLSSTPVGSALACAILCDQNSNCVGWAWDSCSATPSSCWLKQASTSMAYITSPCRTSGPKLGEIGVDRPNGDISGYNPIVLPSGSTAALCASQCVSVSGCIAWAFDSQGTQNCWLKNSITTAYSNSARISGIQGQLNTNSPYFDLGSITLPVSSSATQCSEFCSKTAGCNAWLYQPPTPSCGVASAGMCWAKSQISTGGVRADGCFVTGQQSTSTAAAAATKNIYVQNNKLFVNSLEFIVKGVDYSPSPLGIAGIDWGSGYGGTGFCSPKLTPWGEYKSACYDSDFFDGSTDLDPTRFPQGFAPIWQRDFPQIKSIGANTIRLYNTNPSTLAATKVYSNLYTHPTGKDHTQFMALAERYGLYVIYPLYSDNNGFANLDEATYKKYLRFQIDEVGNSPALLMWQLGNEASWTWNTGTQWNDPNLMAKFNRYADYIRRYTLSRWGRRIPVTTAIVNQAAAFPYQVQNFHVDIFSANVFGDTFGTLFTGTSSVTGMTQLVCQYNKPFLMTEIYRTWAAYQGYPAGDINEILNNVLANINNGLLGAVYFEQTDEPGLGKDFGAFSLAVAYNGNKNSTSTDAWFPDAIVAKQQYTDLKSGTYNGVAYNLNSNWFSLLGRAPTPLSSTADPCTAIGTFKTCPGSGNPKCSGNGVCNRITGTCSCASGWSGSSCSVAVCPGSPQCSSQGKCSTLVTPPECLCNAGFYGPTCSSTTASVASGTCPGGCSNNGICNTTTTNCSCFTGWVGADCAVTDVSQPPLAPYVK